MIPTEDFVSFCVLQLSPGWGQPGFSPLPDMLCFSSLCVDRGPTSMILRQWLVSVHWVCTEGPSQNRTLLCLTCPLQGQVLACLMCAFSQKYSKILLVSALSRGTIWQPPVTELWHIWNMLLSNHPGPCWMLLFELGKIHHQVKFWPYFLSERKQNLRKRFSTGPVCAY